MRQTNNIITKLQGDNPPLVMEYKGLLYVVSHIHGAFQVTTTCKLFMSTIPNYNIGMQVLMNKTFAVKAYQGWNSHCHSTI